MAKKTNEQDVPKYVTLLEEEKITVKDLPKEIENKINGYKMSAGRQKSKPSDAGAAALKENDLLICDMIQTWLENDIDEEAEAKKAKEEEDRISAEAKAKEDEEKRLADEKLAADQAEVKRKEKEAKLAEQSKDAVKAAKVESELSKLFDSEKSSLTIEELKKSAPVCYQDIFDNYTEGEENGIQTTRFSLIETEKDNFQLTKISK